MALGKISLLTSCFTALSWLSYSQTPDSVTVAVAPQYDDVGMVHRFWLGDSYRQLYSTPVKIRVMELGKEKGGLKVVKLGGGMQTQSLRLVDSTGREWVLRSIQKFPERSLPESLRKTIAKDIVQDQISIAHPFGALTVPPFNEKLNLPHAAPQLVYVGDDPGLGEYRELFKNRSYMFEPRMPDQESDTDNTLKVIRKLVEDNDKWAEQKLTLRARLLDFVLGDWDRHEDNWRWEPRKEKGNKIYTPVPRDRDKVYYKTSGVFPVLLSYQWLKANVQPFGPKIRNVAHWNFNARHFDRFFLNRLSKDDWQQEVTLIQNTLTDSLIDFAMRQMPDTIVALSAPELTTNIRARRDGLMETSLSYYASLARIVDIPFSGKNEFANIHYQNDGRITLNVHNKKKDGTEGRLLFERTFLPQETEEVRVYGIAGQDVYSLEGTGKSPIKLRVIGGSEYDQYASTENFQNRRKVWLYENKDTAANSWNDLAHVRMQLKKDSAVHDYQYDSFVYDRKGTLLNLSYGIDRGLIFGLGYLIENQGFRKTPFAYRHEFMASYLTRRESFIFSYSGIFKELIGSHDLTINLSSLGPKNLSNFFGYGNKTIYEKSEKGIGFYRNRYDLVDADILLENNFSDHWKIYYGSSAQFYTSRRENNLGRFFEEWYTQSPDEQPYGDKFFTGISVGGEYDSRDHVANAKKGIWWTTRLNWNSELGGQQQQHTSLQSSFSFYKSIANEGMTLANRTGFETVWGDPYFFQHAQIGGEQSLRGFNSQRFTGKTALYNNLELRVKMLSYASYLLPGTLGAIGFYDVGRVWMTDESANNWHMGYGGGLYFMPGDLLTIQGLVGFSKEATLPYISVGLAF
ncbi:MAG: BamA/TamA family outer membrane protein [Sphingobacterium sp.]